MLKVYCAGPIADCSDEECIDWRENVKKELKGKYEVLDPMARDYRLKDDKNEITPEEVVYIVEADKQDILDSDVILVYPFKPSVGTSMEVLFAYTLGKPVITIGEEKYMSPWLIYHSTLVVPTFQFAYGLLDDFYQNRITETKEDEI